MARRPVFLPQESGLALVRTSQVDFEWHAGLSVNQKQRCISSLHEAARQLLNAHQILEVSSKSATHLGVSLSAFNLSVLLEGEISASTVECVFQSSKVFEHGGPFTDLMGRTSREAKSDPRLQTSGRLLGFHLKGINWPLEPPTIFYDWLYLNALRQCPALLYQANECDAFTDIEFNPSRSINCQAYALALACSLMRRGIFEEATASIQFFLHCVRSSTISNAHRDDDTQRSLI